MRKVVVTCKKCGLEMDIDFSDFIEIEKIDEIIKQYGWTTDDEPEDYCPACANYISGQFGITAATDSQDYPPPSRDVPLRDRFKSFLDTVNPAHHEYYTNAICEFLDWLEGE